jgi:lipoate-protein ligase B
MMKACDIGMIGYEESMDLQRGLRDMVSSRQMEPGILLLEHPPVFTVGRRGNMTNILASPDQLEREGIEVIHTDRGGDVTYHGPGQLVGYIILNLRRYDNDLPRYVNMIEESLIRLCKSYGVDAFRLEEHRGVWAPKGKIGSIGVRVEKWITTHGFAFNVSPKREHFDMIISCGIDGIRMSSLCDYVETDMTEVKDRYLTEFCQVFDLDISKGTLEEVAADSKAKA